ncbi:hypothetical protein RHMOL_Rhmol04G0201700 [Rhododendron molle]|uniref:Uncharacterized protein n=1 Tax=Rhododendron molle TaxID=49168 RepID=A0ACC0P2B7_RHOML|nr:hypothetical protein RHMOL_Rhmol04G0201700 [Rhododendron molle]
MAEHDNGGSEGEVVDRPEDRGGPMETQTGDQTATEGAVGTSAVVADGGNGDEGQQQEVGGRENRRATEAKPRATEEAGAVGSSAELVGSGTVAEGSPIVGGSSVSAEGSSAMGDDPGLNWSPPRNPTRGKGAAIEEEETTEVPTPYRADDVLFRPAATSSSHVPITKYDVAEHLPDEMLAKLLEDNPLIREIVLKAKEERA